MGTASAEPAWVVENKAAREARDKKDWPVYKQHLVTLVPLMSGHPRIVLSLAQAEAQLGNSKEALSILVDFAGAGLVFDPNTIPELIPVLELPEAAPVRQRLAENAKPVSRGRLAFDLADPGLLAEDLAYDPTTKRTYVSSIRKRKILVIDTEGKIQDLVTTGQDGIGGVFGIALDPKGASLWATVNTVPQSEDFKAEDKKVSALVRFELPSGKLLERHELTIEGEPSLAELAVAADGTVFVSESREAGLYILKPGAKALEPLGVPEGELASPQGLVLTPDGKRLFVADYLRGIAVVDLQTRDLSWLKPATATAINGIDGLLGWGKDLIAVQNGTSPVRIVRIRLNEVQDSILGVEILESGLPELGDPTHAVWVDGSLLILANSGWDRVGQDGSMNIEAGTQPPHLRRIEPGASP